MGLWAIQCRPPWGVQPVERAPHITLGTPTGSCWPLFVSSPAGQGFQLLVEQVPREGHMGGLTWSTLPWVGSCGKRTPPESQGSGGSRPGPGDGAGGLASLCRWLSWKPHLLAWGAVPQTGCCCGWEPWCGAPSARPMPRPHGRAPPPHPLPLPDR